MADPGYFATITYEDRESGGMGAKVEHYDSLTDALRAMKVTAKDLSEQEEYHIVSITIVNAQPEP